MSKQLTMWCVFDDKGRPVAWTLSEWMEGSQGYMVDRAGLPWAMFVGMGYTCREVRVTIEEVKP